MAVAQHIFLTNEEMQIVLSILLEHLEHKNVLIRDAAQQNLTRFLTELSLKTKENLLQRFKKLVSTKEEKSVSCYQ